MEIRNLRKKLILKIVLGIIVISAITSGIVYATEFGNELSTLENGIILTMSGEKISIKSDVALGGSSSIQDGIVSADSIVADINSRITKNMTGREVERILSSNGGVIDRYKYAFCAKHGKGLSSAGSPILNTVHKGSYNVTDSITYSNGAYTVNGTYPDICDSSNPAGNRTTASNFIAIKYSSGSLKNIQTCYGKIIDGNTNIIPYAVTYTDKYPGGKHYSQTNAQKAIWQVTGDTAGQPNLYKAGKAVDELDAQIANHGNKINVTAEDKEHPGTVLINENTYRVGPFHMDDYAYVYSDFVKEYSGKGLNFPGLVGGIDGGYITLKTDSGNHKQLNFGDNGLKVVYKDFYGNGTKKYNGGKSGKGDTNRFNSANFTTKIPAEERLYPFPNSVFFIDIPKDFCDDNKLTTLDSMTFNYRQTTTDGNGDVIVVTYAKTVWEQKSTGNPNCTIYNCQWSTVGLHGHESQSQGGGDVICSYCREEINGKCNIVTHQAPFKCAHGYMKCQKANWEATSCTSTYGQPILVCNSARVDVTDTPWINKFNIRLTTDITIKKYVKEIKHATNEEITFGKNVETSILNSEQKPSDRKKMTDEEKQNDPVYAEYGDIITYSIDLINNQDYEVKVQIKDILPENIELINRDFKNYKWITIRGNKTKKLELELMTVANDDKLYVNEVKLVTKNKIKKDKEGNVDFVRTTDRYKGPVVNLAEVRDKKNIISKEYHRINDYDLDIDKYITNYKHEIMTENNKNAITNENYDISFLNNNGRLDQKIDWKKNYPVPVENGEQFTYSIRLTNNSVKSGTNKVATKIRPSEIIDTLENGLEYVEIKGYICHPDGRVRYTLGDGDFSLTEDTSIHNKFYIRLNDKQGNNYLVVEPNEYIIYEMTVKVVESNMYLPIMENRVNISVLTNINNGTSTSLKCLNCEGTGEIISYEECSVCHGGGNISKTEDCTECSGTGKSDSPVTCNNCNGTGTTEEICNHNIENTTRTYKCEENHEIQCMPGEVAPSTCDVVLSEGSCDSTEFKEMCLLCGKEKAECSHFRYECTGIADHTHDAITVGKGNSLDGLSCPYKFKCGEYYSSENFTYTYQCNQCGNITSSNYLNTTTSCKQWLPAGITQRECNGTLNIINSKCNNCSKEYTNQVVRECRAEIACTNTEFPRYCSPTGFKGNEHLESDSAHNHYKIVCSKCGEEYETKVEKCTRNEAEICNGKLEMYCEDCSNTGKIDVDCRSCGGSGEKYVPGICNNCNGSGKEEEYELCTNCLNRGIIAKEDNCTACGGSGNAVNVANGNRIVRTADNRINRNLAKNKDDDGDGTNEQSSEFVRMKDLVISGYVWLDMNRDGYMNEDDTKLLTDQARQYYNVNGSTAGKQNITVRLYSVIDGKETLVRTTKTDNRGRYTFSNYYDETTKTLSWYHDYKNICWEEYNETNLIVKPYSRNSKDYIVQTDQRIDKATNKDKFGNYTANSKYINYYIEFEYDGIIYKSTEYYSGMDNLNGDSKSADYGKYDINYPIDSNAAEFKDVREKFNDTYEYISYDVAYGTDLEQKGQTVDPQTGVVTTATVEDNTNSSARLSFDKTGHTSQLMDEPSRIMTARSFIKNTTRKDLVSQSENPDGWVNNEIKNSSIENTNLLWLFKHNENTNSETPATEYLKYINLGLELRENVDIALTKDVYKVKTTIDGEQIEYTLNQNNGLNGDMPNYDYNSGNGENGASTYLNNYICPAPYGLDLYESDYKMRIEQYKANAVKAYKGLNAESELNVEVTYRITVANKAINDDQSVNGNNVKDTKLGVKVHEILDLYDENFMQIQFNPDGTIKTGAIPAHEINSKAKTNSGNYNEITVKNKDENGYLVDAKIAIGEAWYFRKIEEGSNVAPENRYRIDENSKLPLTYNNEIGQTVDVESKQTQSKPVYIQDVNGEYEKVPLVLRSQSYRDGKGKYSYKENNDDFSADGYNTLYISGMGNVLINEGEDLDIYVKYVLDKEAIEMENTNEDYEETKNTETTSSSSSTTTGNTLVTTVENTIKETSEKKVKIDRSLKIAERILGVVSNKNTEVDGTAPNVVARKDSGRGLEGIAEVNAYSVWYADGSEAALVDMDSNAGNIGNQNSNLIDKLKDEKDTSTRKTILDTSKNEKASNYVSGDEYTYYEDMTYKTGIELTADGTEWTKEQVNEKWKNKKIKIITQKVEDKTIRELSGMVWDDTRSESSGVAGDTQYIGDGIYDTSIKKQEQALMNDNIGVNYKNNKAQEILYNLIGRDKNKELDEEQDIKVRNAKAELVEIVEIPQSTGESHYYEQVLSNVTWEQVQHLRTNAEGEYLLKGFVPGKYIVRFTYGDTIKEEDLSAQEKAFLGEDTKYVTSDMQIFNGQDYKTTQFAYEMEDYRVTEGKGNNSQENLATVSDDAIGTIDNYATDSSKTPKNINNDDEVLAALERPNLSDARDDEIRRLDVNNYSEIMINKKAEILKGLANGTKLTNSSLGTDNEISVNYYKNFENSEYQSQREEALKELTNNTHMNAETVEFLVKPEKLTYEQTTSEENIYHNYIANDSNIYYDELETIEYKTTNNRKYKIQNIDMGIEYRPETAISLIKEIKDIQLVTSDGNILVDLKLYTKQEDNGKITHHVDMENSIGAELVQFITNEYEIDPLLNSILGEDNSAIGANEEQQQGFMYIAVDDDILQGCRVILQYKFTAQNNSEIDRISESLNSIRFYGNTKTQELINSYQGLKHKEIDSNGNIIDVVSNILDESNETDYNKDEYTANNLARNMVYYDVYSLDSDGIEYRNRAKTMTKLDDDIDQASMKYDTDGTEGYFGKYVGYAYYTGNPDAKRVPRNETEAKNLDMISELKFDKIIDYIDTNLEFGQLSQTDITQLQNLESRATTSTTEPVGNLITDVVDKNYTGNQFWSNNSSQSVSRLSDYLFSLNSPWGQNVSNPNEETLENVLTDLDGVKYKSLVITTADKQSEDDPNTKNKAFSKFLKPSIMSEEDSIANVYLPVSKLLSSAEDTNNMVYENIAEVIQFTVLTGRRTNFATTVGNADIHEVYKQTKDEYERYGSIEFVTAAYETDTSATETITLAPPTGLMRNRRVIYETIDTTKNIVQIVVIAIAVVVVVMSITRFTILKIKKKRYK